MNEETLAQLMDKHKMPAKERQAHHEDFIRVWQAIRPLRIRADKSKQWQQESFRVAGIIAAAQQTSGAPDVASAYNHTLNHTGWYLYCEQCTGANA